MRHWLFGAAVLALLVPATASAQPYAPRDVYGNLLSVPRYGYPPGYPADGYIGQLSPSHATGLAAPRQGCGPDDRICVWRDAPVYEPEDEGLDYAISPQYERQVVAYRGRRTARNGHHRYTGEISLSYPAGRPRHPLRDRCRPPRLRMGRPEIGHDEKENGPIGVRPGRC